jgi:hypothetical protein
VGMYPQWLVSVLTPLSANMLGLLAHISSTKLLTDLICSVFSNDHYS